MSRVKHVTALCMHLLCRLCNFWTSGLIRFVSLQFSWKEKCECQKVSIHGTYSYSLKKFMCPLTDVNNAVLLLEFINYIATQFCADWDIYSTVGCHFMSSVCRHQIFLKSNFTVVSTFLISFGSLCAVPCIYIFCGGIEEEVGTNLKLVMCKTKQKE